MPPPPSPTSGNEEVIVAIQEVRDLLRVNRDDSLVEAAKVLGASFETSARLLLEPLTGISKRVCQLSARLAELEETLIDMTIVLQSNKRTKVEPPPPPADEEGAVL